jgi:hypothetical protein
MQFLLNLPAWISFLLVSVIITSIALAGLRFVRKKYPAEVLKENHEVAAIIFNAFGLLYGVLSLLSYLLREVDMTKLQRICNWKLTRPLIFFTAQKHSLTLSGKQYSRD